jgi:RNA polymerase sigma-70 factor (ECF subfamily)
MVSPKEGTDPVYDSDSWERLILLLSPIHDRAAATARRLSRDGSDGDDLFQDAVIRAWEKLPTLREESRFPSWFYSVLLSVHRNRWRRSFWRRFQSLEGEDAGSIDVPGEDGAEWEERRRGAERVSRALATLPAVQREAVVLFEMEGFSIQDIAELQGVSVPAVKTRLARGRERLRRHYRRLGMTPGLAASAGKDLAGGASLFRSATRPALRPERQSTGPMPEGEPS